MKTNTYLAGTQKALALFHRVYDHCPAYRDFVDGSGIKPSDIQTPADFKKIPCTDKHNYIKRYPLEQRLYDDKQLSDYYMISSSSGSSGEPTFWPRDYKIDKQLEKAKAALLEQHFQVSQKRTLCVITFGLGVWTAGMLSSKLTWPTGENHQFSVVTPGIDKESAFELISRLHGYYDQVVIMGYPPFLADLIQFAQECDFDIKKANIKLLYTSERISERWRDHMTGVLSDKKDRDRVVGFYACSDTGIIGVEEKASIELLAHAAENSLLCEALFGEKRPPTFVAFNPEVKYVESQDNEIVITADQPVPLIRYNIHDRGNVVSASDIMQVLKKFKTSLSQPLQGENFIYVFGRSDAVKLTANIYADDIIYCLENSRFAHKLSGAFKYGTIELDNLKYRLKVLIYTKPGVNFSTAEKQEFETEFYHHLLEANNDFRMIQSGTTIEPFLYEYYEDSPDKYKSSKLKYFL